MRCCALSLNVALCVLISMMSPGCYTPQNNPDRNHLPDELSDPDADCEDKLLFYRDADEDDFGDREHTKIACSTPEGYASDGGDCDDNDGGTYPGAIEVCDGVDRNCNGIIDENAIGAPLWYPDADEDGFGVLHMPFASCQRPDGFAGNTRDCNDDDPNIHPGADDPACDGIDQDCSGLMIGRASANGTEYGSLQQALADAESGSTILVCDGVHPISGVFEGDLILKANSDDTGAVQLVPASAGRMLDVRGDVVALHNLTFSGGRSTEDGGAVRIAARRVHIAGCEFRDNHSDGRGGAVSVELTKDVDSTLELSTLSMIGNSAESDGGGLYVGMPARVTLSTFRDLVFHQNSSGRDGGGIFIDIIGRTGTFAVIGATAMDNTAVRDGGFLAASGPHVVVRTEHTDARRNTAGRNGGFASAKAGELGKFVLHDALLIANKADDSGGAVQVSGDDGSELYAKNVDARQNAATAGGVFAVRGTENVTADVILSELWANRAIDGAAIDMKVRTVSTALNLQDAKLWGQLDGPAISLRGESASTVVDWQRGELLRNDHGGLALPGDAEVYLRSVDMGADGDDNRPDLTLGEHAYDWRGLITDVTCELGDCSGS